ncbi:MAG TPA: PEP/pyruvate-binding domain-containing protein [Chloroflexota bacterium]|nr:PEP/pyruvate-binding domain-containing protein [Chloroflexota bacterium]
MARSVGERAGSTSADPEVPFVLPFAALDRGALALAGGKAANLGEMIRAGLPVPPGFCVTTAAYELVAAGADLGPELAALETARPDDRPGLGALASAARAKLVAAPVPARLAAAILAAYRELSDAAPVAVRSSATAEDLPTASFAGQQDTYLNVVGGEALLDAVRRCWASLWTDRAVAYRASNGIDQRAVRLAVAVQRMVDARVAGVLFTANPLTGRRRQAVIEASPGLGEAIVSGAVNPDHFVVDCSTGAVVERRLGDKRVAVRPAAGGGTERVAFDGGERACLSDEQLRALAALGARVEAHYGAPQDTEFAIDGEGRIWLVQARPITTLFPLPAGAPTTDDDLRVYFSLSVAQGVYQPITPMGLQAFRLFGTAAATLLGRPPRDRYAGPATIQAAAGRLYADVTPLLRSALGRRVAVFVAQHMEARTAAIIRSLLDDPRLALRPTPPWRVVRHLFPALVRTGIPVRLAEALLSPSAARTRAARTAAAALAADLPPGADAAAALAAAERMLLRTMPLVPKIAAVFAAGLVAQRVAGILLGDQATADERQTVLRALPHNPTTEMDLALWALAQRVRGDAEASRDLRELAPERLAERYRSGALPAALQRGLLDFLRVYGHRGVAEIDLGVPRWSEDPTHILGALANYLRLEDPALAPDAQFRRGAEAAEAMVRELTARARRRGRLRGVLVGFLLGRVRALAGMREAPKFHAIAALARARARLGAVGEELARAGRLERAEDVFFVDLPEARAALAGADLGRVVRERRAAHEREMRRRHVPRILLSDGSEPAAGDAVGDLDGALRGTPASAGAATGLARVVLDPTGARLDPGEILVAPSTDPGWTPLFLTAGGLVMEMGGAMSHGAVVAREYGIPAVVGVPGATERIRTGQRIVVDGTEGLVRIEGERRAGGREADGRPSSRL